MGSVAANDLEMYERFAHEWWTKDSGRFRSLQGISEFRLALLSKWIPDIGRKTVIDLGCGGGLLAAPLSWQGAQVTGMDLSAASIAQAEAHSAPTAAYRTGDVRRVPLPNASADVVLLADVLDHIADYPTVLQEASRLLRPGGLVYVNTINRTLRARLLAIWIGENIGLVPKGTHDYRLLISPDELRAAAEAAGLKAAAWQGERPAVWRTAREWAIHFAPTESLGVAYSALFVKGRDER